MSNTAKILRCAAEALERLEATNKKPQHTKATRAPVEKNIMHRALIKRTTKK